MPEAIASPPPPKPAPKPSAPPPKPPKPTPAPPKPEERDVFHDAFADIEATDARDVASKGPQKPEKKPKPEPPKKDEPESSEESAEKDAASESDVISEDIQKPTVDEAGKKDAEGKDAETKPPRAAELRTAYEKSKTTIKEKDAEIGRLKGELESKAKTEDPEKKTLIERLTAAEKKAQAYEEEIRFTNYKNHPEFKEKYEDPYQNAFKKALADFQQIHVTDEEGNKRLATQGDLDAMLRMSIAQVDELATEKFGHSAARVIRHVEKLRDLADAYHSALEDAKTKGGEREKTKQIEFQKQNEQRSKLWQEENDAAVKKFPQWFSPKEGDDEANAALEKGYKLADAVFLNREQEPIERLVKMDAAVRHRAAAFGRLVLEGKRKDAKIAELEKSLAEYESSDPDAEGDEPPKKVITNWQTSADAELDAIERKSRQ